MILFSFLSIVTIVTNLVLISFALLAKKSNNVSRSFSLLATTTTIWMIGVVILHFSDTAEAAMLWIQVFFVGCLFIPSFYFQFICSLTQTHDKTWNIFKYLSYALSGALLIINISGEIIHHVSYEQSFYQPRAGSFYYLYSILFGFCFVGSMYLLWKRLKIAVVQEKRRLQWMFGIACVGIVAGIIDLLSVYGIPLDSLGHISLSVFSLSVAFVVVKYKLIEFEIHIKRQHILSLTNGLIAGIFLILIYIFCHQSWFITMIWVCLAGIIFYPLSNGIQRIIESHIFRDIIERGDSPDMVEIKIPATFVWKTLLDSMQNIATIMKIQNLTIILTCSEMDEYELDFSIGFTQEELRKIKLKGNKGIISWMKSEKKALIREGLRLNPKFEYTGEAIENDLELLKATMALPLINKELMIGILFIGENENNYAVEAFDEIRSDLIIAIENTLAYDAKIRYFLSIVEALIVNIEAKDRYMAGHVERVTRYSVAIARRLGFTTTEIEAVQMAALLHDIGKYGITDAILQKSGRLSLEEFEIIKKHTTIGKDILSGVDLSDEIINGVFLHHERRDGKGYHPGQTNEIAEIICVASSYDALISDRPYRKAMTVDESIMELERNSGTMYNPDVVDAFIGWLRE
ncbi:MAG: HD domain-containing phosphohydrolase [Candidatus Desantisbacteria bacterium]